MEVGVSKKNENKVRKSKKTSILTRSFVVVNSGSKPEGKFFRYHSINSKITRYGLQFY